MEVIKEAVVTKEEFVAKFNSNSGCEDGGHCKYCINGSNYSN